MLKPLGDRVIIEVIEEEEKTASGLVLTSSAKEKPQTGKVVAVAEDKEKIPVNAGDKVLFEKYAGSEIEHEGKKYLILHTKDIMAIVE